MHYQLLNIYINGILNIIQALRSAQEQEISQLERVVEDKKFDHENKVRILKAKFLEEKRLFEVAMEDHIRTMADQANSVQPPPQYEIWTIIFFFFIQQAAKCLKDQTERIRRENHELRHQLVSLIQTTDELQSQKRKLEKQYKALLHEHQFNQELHSKGQKPTMIDALPCLNKWLLLHYYNNIISIRLPDPHIPLIGV